MRKAASLLSIAALLAALPAAAQTWTGAGPDNNWSTGANWSGGVAPASSPTTQLDFTLPSPRPSPFVDAPWTVNQLRFFPTVSLSGQAITFAGTTPNILSQGTATIANAIVLTGPTPSPGPAPCS